MNGRIEKLGEILFGYEGLDSEQIAYYIWAFWYKSVGLKRIQARVIELARENRELKIDLSAYKRAFDWHEKQLAGKHAAETIEWDTIVNFKRPGVIKRIWDWFRGNR